MEFTGGLLSIELGPGLLRQIFDGLQNPLPGLAEQYGFFLQRGKYMHALPRDAKWAFTPVAKPGDAVRAGDTLGTVPEGVFTHRIMVPFGLKGRYTVKDVAPAGDYTVVDDVATLQGPDGREAKVQMMQRWPRRSAQSTRSSPSRSAAPTASPGRSAPGRRSCSRRPRASRRSTS